MENYKELEKVVEELGNLGVTEEEIKNATKEEMEQYLKLISEVETNIESLLEE